ncbi:phage tail length tape measure family protein [Rhodanobacter sp. L36]|uniref:phage tail length tape measure family protein n=1 Tax=Rhodanobacter sp. L36 TaxID=1747221 RepID=UPI00131E2EAC|nr:phage tail length tape measure family protein [Rhodanobacter sp. L36]
MSGDEEIKVSLTADYAELDQGMEAGTESVVAGTQTMAAAIAESSAAIATSNAVVAESADAASLRIKAMVAASLEQQAANGAIAESETSLAERLGLRVEATAEQIAATQAAIAAQDAQMEGVEAYIGAEVAATTATETATMATITNTTTLALNGQVAREVGVMVGEFARGNYTRLEGSTITLANRTALLSSALSVLATPLGLATAGAAALGYEVFEAGSDFRAMEGAVIATGDASGYTAGQLDNMADRVGKATGDVSGADTAFQKLAASGRFAGDDLRLVGTAAAEMASMTGESVGTIISQIERLQQDPLRAVANLNDQFHFLTVAEYEQMEQLVAAGDVTGAASIAYAAMADSMGVKTEQVHEHVNVLIKAWRDLKGAWNDAMRGADVALGGGDTATQLADAQLLLKNLQNQNAELLQVHSNSVGITEEVRAQTKVVTDLTAKLHEQSAAAAQVGDAAKASASKIDAMSKAHKSTSGAGDLEKDLRDQEAEQQISYDRRAQFEMEYWGTILQTAKKGTAEYTAAWGKVQELQKQLDDQQLASSNQAAQKSTQAAKAAAAGTINSLEMQRNATMAYSAERTQIDEKIVESAKRLYGDQSTDYRRALAEQIADARAAASEKARIAQQQRALDEQDLTAAHDQAMRELETKREEYQNEYSAGDISAQKLLDLERGLVNQKLALDTAYYKAKEKLDAGDAMAVKKDQAGIVASHQSSLTTMAKDEQKFHKNSEKEWSQYAKRISASVGQAITGMIFQHQSLKSAVTSIGQSMAEQFIESAIEKPLEAWIEKEAGMLTATIGTLTGQATATDTQRATDAAAESLATVASITKAAGVAGAQGTASFAGAPWPVDIGAPAFGAAMALEAMSYATVASASGGWEDVPADQLAMIHKNEMVLPAHVAQSVRDGASSQGSSRRGKSVGGGTGAFHVHIHAMDAKSFKQALRGGLGTELASYAKGKSANSAATRSRG